MNVLVGAANGSLAKNMFKLYGSRNKLKLFWYCLNICHENLELKIYLLIDIFFSNDNVKTTTNRRNR